MSSVQDRAQYYLVDSRGEGGLVSELDRVPMVDQPTLIIGLGGTGADALLHTKYVLHRKLKYPAGQSKPSRLAYLAIDTDANDLLKKRVGDIRLDASEKCDITEPLLKTFMSNHNLIVEPYKRDWLSKGIPPLNVEFGAGGVRQYGRFMLISKADYVVGKIRSAVSNIWAAGKENGSAYNAATDAINVYILTGISGGTGSGTFLDVAYMVREIITKEMHYNVRMRGIIFMPDVNLCKVKQEDVRKYIPVNGYAALKELDFWMNPERGRSFQQQYTSSLRVNTTEKPFELCFMVSPNGTLETDYTTCMQTTGETLLNILSASEDNGMAVQGFESYIVNLVSMLPHIKKPYAGNYIYAAMGMDERRLQLDQMATYIAYYLLTQVQSLFERTPIKEDVDGFFKRLKLDDQNMQVLFNSGLNVQPYNGVKNLDGFKEAIASYKHAQVLDETLLEQELEVWARQCAIFYAKQRDTMVDGRMEAISGEIEKLFTDQEIGPYYAHRMLHNTVPGAPDIIKRIKEAVDKLEAYLLTADNLREAKFKNYREAKESARKNRYVPLMAGARYNDYVEAVFDLYNHDRYTSFAEVLHKTYRELLEKVIDYNNLIVEKFSNLLQALTEVFRANSDIITEIKVDGNTHTWNVFNFSEILPYIDKAIEEMRHEGLTKDLVHEFLQLMLDEREAWLDDNGDLGASFSKFVSEKFGSIMELTLEQHYKTMLGLNTDQELRDHISTVVLPQLRSGAKVLYNANEALCSVSNAAFRSMVAYPSMATNIGNAVNSFVTSENLDCDIVPSHRRGSLFWFNAAFGLPLYAFNAIANYQRAYDQYGLNDKHLGRHLKMGVNENWNELLPPLMPDSTWDYYQYENPILASKNDANRAMFEEAWEKGLLMPMTGGDGKYVLGRVDTDAFNNMIASAALTADEQATLLEQGAAAAASIRVDKNKLAAYIKAAKEFESTAWKETGEMFKSDTFDMLRGGKHIDINQGDVRTRQILSENLTLTPDMAEKLSQQLALKNQLAQVIKAHELYGEMGDQEKVQRHFFAECLFYGLYRKIPPKIYQLDVTDAGVQSFLLMSLNDYTLAPAKDKYYAMFRKFLTFTPEQHTIMQRIIDLRNRQLDQQMQLGNVDRYTQYIATIQDIDTEIANRMGEIDMDLSYDHPEIREFYAALRAEFEHWLAE